MHNYRQWRDLLLILIIDVAKGAYRGLCLLPLHGGKMKKLLGKRRKKGGRTGKKKTAKKMVGLISNTLSIYLV